jgi:oligopeptide/dipeptide ABC transporter ATP-binding protein
VTEPVLAVQDLRVRFATRRGVIHAVNGASFAVGPGETLGIVGESGCGKSATALALLGILPRAGSVVGGRALLDGIDLLALSERELRRVRGRRIAMIFQDPLSSLNPVLTVGRQIRETVRTHLSLDGQAAQERAGDLLEQVGISRSRLGDYPHQFSGGMRQRVMVAIALACEPAVLIADEPTTALDVTIQAQILELLRGLVAQRQTALILITHHIGIVAGMCDRVHVMYAGTFVETGPKDEVLRAPRHPYTLGLLQALPHLGGPRKIALRAIAGAPAELLAPPIGCPFAPRCERVADRCRAELPRLLEVAAGHAAACFHPVSPP